MTEQRIEKRDILKQHQLKGDIIRIKLIYPNVAPIFYKGQISKVNFDNFIFHDIIDGELMLGFDCLQEIRVLEEGKNERFKQNKS